MPGSGYATISRKKILEFLKKNSDRTVAVADIDHYLKAQDCEVNITTIYRYLDKLAKDGTVIKYVAEKGNQAVYQYVELGHHCEEHLHLQCVKCGKIIHLECEFRRAYVRFGPRADRRGAGRHAQPGRGRPHNAGRDPRDGFCPPRGQPRGVHGAGRHCGAEHRRGVLQ